MSRKQDMIAALECRQPEGAVPIWELEFHAWDTASGRHVVLGHEFENLTPAQQERAMHANAEIILDVCRQMNFAGLSTPGTYWEQAPGQLAYYVLPGDSRFRQIEILRKMSGGELMLLGSTGGVISANYSEDFCEKLFEQPEEIVAQAERALQTGLELARRFRDLGADAVFSASDIADNSGPFFNPEQMQRFILPFLNRWAEGATAMGLYTIFHSDGQLTRYVDAIAATAVHALQAIDPVAGMDMLKTRQIVGDRLCLCGNIDCGLLVRGTPETVFAATQQLLSTCQSGGGLVLGASNAVQTDVPIQNYRAMIQAWEIYGCRGGGAAPTVERAQND